MAGLALSFATSRHGSSRADRALFAVKTRVLIARKALMQPLQGGLPRLRQTTARADAPVLVEIVTPLYTETTPEEVELQLGKVENLRVAARLLDGTVIPAGAVFSFWRQIGRPSAAKGFVEGRELRLGCLVPAIAGGICQLTNSLFQAAKRTGCEIVERHGHSKPIENAAFGPGEDATVFWNYVDFKFRPSQAMRLRVFLTATDLVVRLDADHV